MFLVLPAHKSTTPIEASEPANATATMLTPERPPKKLVATTVKKASTIFAPEEIPSSNGLQMGLRKYVWIKYPETPRAPPKSAAAHRRGRRTLHTMVCAALPAN